MEFLAADLASRLSPMRAPHVGVHLLVFHGLITNLTLVPTCGYLSKVLLVVLGDGSLRLSVQDGLERLVLQCYCRGSI